MKMDTEQEIRDKYYQDGLEDGKKEGFKAGLEKARELAEKARMDYVMSLKDDEQNFTLKEGANLALNKITAMIDEELKGAK